LGAFFAPFGWGGPFFPFGLWFVWLSSLWGIPYLICFLLSVFTLVICLVVRFFYESIFFVETLSFEVLNPLADELEKRNV